MNRSDFDDFLNRLSADSEHNVIDPASLDWPDSVDADAWYFTPELISLYGTATWDSLDERQRKRLSLAEAANFFSLNIHGETYLIREVSRIAKRLSPDALTRYLQHFIDEEERHMQYFSAFCDRYAGKTYADRIVHSEPDGTALGLLALFARINLFEEIVDYYNRVMARDARLAPIAREINRIHHVEEMRHLGFGRHFLRQQLESGAYVAGSAQGRELRAHLQAYLEFVWKQYYNPDVYADAGITDAFAVWRESRDGAGATAHREMINRKRLGYLCKLDLLETP